MEPCPDLSAALDRATVAALELDLAGARAELGEAERSVGCQVASNVQVARYFLVQGAISHVEGREDAAAWLAAARATRPDEWDDRFDDDARAVWEASSRPERARIVVPFLPEGAQLLLDGRPPPDGGAVEAGLHVVQAVSADAVVLYGAPVTFRAGDAWAPPLAPPEDATPAPAPAPTEPPRRPPLATAPWLAIGVGSAFGAGVQGRGIEEPATQLTVPLEAGLRVRGPVELRLAAAAAPSLTGPFHYHAGAGTDPADNARLPALFGGHAGVTTGGRWRVGAIGEARLPSRLALQAVGATDVGWLTVEVRPGLQLYPPAPTNGVSRGPDPVVSLLVGPSFPRR